MDTHSDLAFDPIKDDQNMHRALTVFCIIRAQCWTHEHRTWYARFLSITLTKAPCTFQEALNFIRLGALWWWQGQSFLGEVGQCLSRRWGRKGNPARVCYFLHEVTEERQLLQSDSLRKHPWVMSFRDSQKPPAFYLPGGLEGGPVAWLRKRSLSVPWPAEAL